MIKKDELLVLTTGEWSDYEMITICKALVDLDIEVLQSEYIKRYNRVDASSVISSRFVTWLISKQFMVELSYRELHFSSYHRDRFEGEDTRIEKIVLTSN